MGTKAIFSLAFCVGLLLFFNTISSGQGDSKLSNYLPNYSTVSPSALYNGVPNISIPLYTISGRGISIPVSISYDASGIKAQQEATSIGLGWVLNAGGYIIHETRDWYDFAGVDRVSADTMAGIDKRFTKGTINYSSSTNVELYEVRHKYDNLPDLFYYNCNGRTGKFFIGDDLSTLISIPETSMQISFESSNSIDIVMVDEDGIEYHFEKEQSIAPADNYINTESLIYVLKTIYTPQRDTVSFTYHSAYYNKPVFKTIFDYVNQDFFQTKIYEEMPVNLVKKIEISGGESIEFEFGERRDDCYSTAPDSIPKIEKVKLLDANGTTKKYFEFDQDYFSSDKFIQYLPERKKPEGEYNLKDENGNFVLYDSIKSAGDIYFEEEYVAFGYIDGVKDTIPDHFFRGNYLFTRNGDTVFAILNDEYLSECLPDLEDAQDFEYDSSLCGGCTYEEAYQEYMNYVSAYHKMLEDYYENNCSPASYIASKVVGGLHYMEVDTNYVNWLLARYDNQSSGSPFRPFYYSGLRTKRLKLEGIQEFSGDGDLSLPPFQFTYNEETNLPSSYTRDYDHWGYYNYLDSIPNHSPVPDADYYSTVFESNAGHGYPPFNGNRDPNEEKMKAGVLEKITYPGGGYIKYDFEANRARSNESGTIEKIVGGLRVKSIERGNGDGDKYYTDYKYEIFEEDTVNNVIYLDTSGIGSGYLYAKDVQYEMGIGFKYEIIPPILTNQLVLVKLGVSNSVLPLQKTKGGYVGYSSVGVRSIDEDGNDLGNTVYRFYANDPQVHGSVSENYVPSSYNGFMKYVVPPKPASARLGTLEQKIIADKWDRILLKEENTYALAEPNRMDLEAASFYSTYIHSYAQTVGRGYYLKYYDPSGPIDFYTLYDLIPKSAKLSSTKNYQYFPDQGGELVDSSYYLYDTPHSSICINDDYMDWTKEYSVADLTGFSYNQDLDAYYSDGVVSGFSFLGKHTNRIVQKLHFKPNGDTIRTRYWYPPHFSDTSTVFAAMEARNIISPAVKVEVFRNGSLIEGRDTRFEFVSGDTLGDQDFILPTESRVFYTDSYEKIAEVTEYDELGNSVETLVTDGNYSSVILGYNRSRVIAQIENARLKEILYQDFEEGVLGDWSSYNSGGTVSTSNSGTGLKSLFFGSGSHRGIQYAVQLSDLDDDGKYTFSAMWWQDDPNSTSDPCLQIKIQHSGGTTYLKKLVALKDEKWVDAEMLVDLSAYTNISNLTLYVLNGVSGLGSAEYGAAFVDEIRFHPSDALMTTYTHDPIFGNTSISDPAGTTLIFEYDKLGRLIAETDQQENIGKKTNYHFKDEDE